MVEISLCYCPLLNEYRMAFFAQWSTHAPHKIHSEFSIFPANAIALTSRLIEQFLLHSLQSLQAEESATRRREAQPKRLRIQRPIIMNGAIQQMV